MPYAVHRRNDIQDQTVFFSVIGTQTSSDHLLVQGIVAGRPHHDDRIRRRCVETLCKDHTVDDAADAPCLVSTQFFAAFFFISSPGDHTDRPFRLLRQKSAYGLFQEMAYFDRWTIYERLSLTFVTFFDIRICGSDNGVRLFNRFCNGALLIISANDIDCADVCVCTDPHRSYRGEPIMFYTPHDIPAENDIFKYIVQSDFVSAFRRGREPEDPVWMKIIQDFPVGRCSCVVRFINNDCLERIPVEF